MKYLMAIMLVGFVLFFAGCDAQKSDNSADTKMAEATQSQMAEAYRQVGMPAIKNFQELKLAKMIAELRDSEDLVCYAYLFNQFTGELVYLGKCMGFGLPYSVQMTNPERVAHERNGHQASSFGTLPQAEPNGLFMPGGLSATWLMMIDETTGEVHPVYIEPTIVVSPFPLIAK